MQFQQAFREHIKMHFEIPSSFIKYYTFTQFSHCLLHRLHDCNNYWGIDHYHLQWNMNASLLALLTLKLDTLYDCTFQLSRSSWSGLGVSWKFQAPSKTPHLNLVFISMLYTTYYTKLSPISGDVWMCMSNIPQESPGHSQQLPCSCTNSNSNSFNFIKL